MTLMKITVYGSSGYTAGELFRLLLLHPRAEITCAVSESHAGESLAHLHPHLGKISLKTVAPQEAKWTDCDCVFFATPHRIAMEKAGNLLQKGLLVIDLSADFRIKDLAVWSHWYGGEHSAAALVREAAYGLPEANRAAIKTARLIANPGCYATAVHLSLLPLLAHADYGKQLGEEQAGELIVDAKSGTSGAGRQAQSNLLFSEVDENLTCYAAEGHRHQPEMEEFLREKYGSRIRFRFVPHLVPMVRGIFTDAYLPLGHCDIKALRACYEDFYCAEPFVSVLPARQSPQPKAVRGSNSVQLSIFAPPNSRYIQVCAALDNLVKGAAGQAIQNMNIACGFAETMGLEHAGLAP